MDKIDIILTVMVAGYGLILSLMLIIWTSLNSYKVSMHEKLEKIREELKDMDRRLCRIEGALSAKDCCVLTDDKRLKKAE